MISSNTIKFIKLLQQKKFRKESGLFVAEGHRLVIDLLNSDLKIDSIYSVGDWGLENNIFNVNHEQISEREMSRISGLTTPSQVLALVKIPSLQINIENVKDSLTLALDDIQDPGNLGTIIRLSDWFGIETVFCSSGTTDAYSPKVVQATMGAIARVRIVYSDIKMLISNANQQSIPVYGTFLNGENIYSSQLTGNGIVVMGNEGNGISDEIGKLIPNRLTIPSFAEKGNGSESLNVAMATAIVCSEFKRRAIP
ncbi:MAG: RNA methyltransferase [Bacteroidetes bacterium HGW-Bacteroidetes-15]|nr:MAG: RNA methyltransferase [Bacteroidetes bacterium HGW-Bacteroidetes-15]